MSQQVKAIVDVKTQDEADMPRREGGRVLERLRAVILLAGGVRETKLSSTLPGSPLELPLERGRSVLDHLIGQTDDLAEQLGRERLAVRVLIGRSSKDVGEPPRSQHCDVVVERDPFDYRGTGGVLRDVMAEYDDQDLVLVGNGSQVLVESLHALAEELAALESDVGVVAHRDGTPSGLMLVRCGCLKAVPTTGFIDMKEQALPVIAHEHNVMVAMRDAPSMLPIRTLADYLAALRAHHLKLAGRAAVSDPFREDFEPTFSIVEEGAKVDPSVRVHDSVVLRGARVEAGAILVRSLVSTGAVVRKDQRVVDRLVGSAAMARRGKRQMESAHE